MRSLSRATESWKLSKGKARWATSPGLPPDCQHGHPGTEASFVAAVSMGLGRLTGILPLVSTVIGQHERTPRDG